MMPKKVEDSEEENKEKVKDIKAIKASKVDMIIILRGISTNRRGKKLKGFQKEKGGENFKEMAIGIHKKNVTNFISVH